MIKNIIIIVILGISVFYFGSIYNTKQAVQKYLNSKYSQEMIIDKTFLFTIFDSMHSVAIAHKRDNPKITFNIRSDGKYFDDYYSSLWQYNLNNLY